MRNRWWQVVGVVAACGGEPAVDDTGVETDDTEVAGPAAIGRCDYTNTFSDGPECKEYLGSAWTETTAAESCGTETLAATAGTFTAGEACPTDDVLGRCDVGEGTPDAYALVFPGTDPADCEGVVIGCAFAQGTFTPSALCEDGGGGGGGGATVFQPFELVCVEPLEGEPPGDGPEGDVCTWTAISACTEEGRRYTDYGSCDAVFTQRPYAPYPVTPTTPVDDPRLDDAAWVAEYDWVTKQVEACACVCCHSTEAAPEAGTSGWYLEAGPIWVDTLDDDGLAVLAGWVDSTAFGAFDPDDNNGFSRDVTGLPTSDADRMVAFLEGELARRGLDRDDFADTEPFGGPLYDQLFYEPGPCRNGEGVARDGTVTWNNGRARYVYVLAEGSQSPGVPPNLDTPVGTIWRLDVAPTADALESGIAYGSEPTGTSQAVPTSGAPAALVPGTTYYVVALKDVYQPLTRCTFTY